MDKDLGRQGETCWWNHGISNDVSEKYKLWKESNQGITSKKNYLKAKKKLRVAVQQAKYKAERERYRNVTQRDDEKDDELLRLRK